MVNYIAESEEFDELFNQLTKIHQFYSKEAERCIKSRAYFAACVMIGSALETMLKHLALLYVDGIDKDNAVEIKDEIMSMSLYDLINVLEDSFLPRGNKNVEGSLSGNLAHDIRQIRNYVHPQLMVKHDRVKILSKEYRETYRSLLKIHDHLARNL